MSSASTPQPQPSTTKMAAKKSKIVVLRLAPDVLRRALPQPTPEETKPASSNSPSTATPDEPVAVDAAATASLQQSESADTPAPDGTPAEGPSTSAPPTNGVKRKGIPGPKPGTKRTLQQTVDANGVPKPRGKPGPKKKPRPYVPSLHRAHDSNLLSMATRTRPCSLTRRAYVTHAPIHLASQDCRKLTYSQRRPG